MADPVVPSMPHGADGQVPHWFVLAGGVVAIVALFVFMKNRQSSATGGSTVAAGTSINAALGSIQEEVMQQTGALSVQAAQNSATASAEAAQNASDISHQIFTATSGLAEQASAYSALQGAFNNYLTNPIDPRINALLEQYVTLNTQATDSLQNQTPAHLASAATGTH